VSTLIRLLLNVVDITTVTLTYNSWIRWVSPTSYFWFIQIVGFGFELKCGWIPVILQNYFGFRIIAFESMNPIIVIYDNSQVEKWCSQKLETTKLQVGGGCWQGRFNLISPVKCRRDNEVLSAERIDDIRKHKLEVSFRNYTLACFIHEFLCWEDWRQIYEVWQC